MRPRGFAIPSLTTVVIVLGLVAAISASAFGFLAWYADANFKRGQAAERLAAIAAGQARDQDVSDAIKGREEQRAAADQRAAAADSKWRAQLRENRKQPLVACPSSTADAGTVGAPGEPETATVGGLRPPGAAGGDRAGGDPGVRLLWRFVGLHDAAFTGLDGKPVFEDSARFALDSARADAASPYELGDAIDVAGENARALSTCRRAYFALRGDLEAARAAWDRKR